MSDTPNYMKKMLADISINGVSKGSITHAYIQHDNWCDYFKRKPCNCNPTIKMVRKDG